MWRDYIDLLRHFGKDTNNAKYVCPADLQTAHDRLVERKRARQERVQLLERKRRAAEEEQRIATSNPVFSGWSLSMATSPCAYWRACRSSSRRATPCTTACLPMPTTKNRTRLSFRATVCGRRVETVEVALDTLKVVQSRGVHNSQTEHHDSIVNLVRRNMPQIEQRMTA